MRVASGIDFASATRRLACGAAASAVACSLLLILVESPARGWPPGTGWTGMEPDETRDLVGEINMAAAAASRSSTPPATNHFKNLGLFEPVDVAGRVGAGAVTGPRGFRPLWKVARNCLACSRNPCSRLYGTSLTRGSALGLARKQKN